MRSILGTPVHIIQDAKRELPAEVIPGVPWPPGFKEEIDAWMAGFFKPQNIIADGEVWKTPAGLHMNPRTYDRVVKTLAKL